MKIFFLIIIVLLIALFSMKNWENCSFAQVAGYSGPKRLVVIKGKITILNHPELGITPDSGGTIIFQKDGCNSCYIGTNADIEGNYKISVGDGKYKVIVRNPSSPDFEMLAPDQERFIDTETLSAKMDSRQVFTFDIKTKLPK